jgi:hypothetical protein
MSKSPVVLAYRRDRKNYSGSTTQVVPALYEQLQNLPVVGKDAATEDDLRRTGSHHEPSIPVAEYIEAARELITEPCVSTALSAQIGSMAPLCLYAYGHRLKRQLTASELQVLRVETRLHPVWHGS